MMLNATYRRAKPSKIPVLSPSWLREHAEELLKPKPNKRTKRPQKKSKYPSKIPAPLESSTHTREMENVTLSDRMIHTTHTHTGGEGAIGTNSVRRQKIHLTLDNFPLKAVSKNAQNEVFPGWPTYTDIKNDENYKRMMGTVAMHNLFSKDVVTKVSIVKAKYAELKNDEEEITPLESETDDSMGFVDLDISDTGSEAKSLELKVSDSEEDMSSKTELLDFNENLANYVAGTANVIQKRNNDGGFSWCDEYQSLNKEYDEVDHSRLLPVKTQIGNGKLSQDQVLIKEKKFVKILQDRKHIIAPTAIFAVLIPTFWFIGYTLGGYF